MLYTVDDSVEYVYYYSLGYEIGNSLIRFFYLPEAALNDWFNDVLLVSQYILNPKLLYISTLFYL